VQNAVWLKIAQYFRPRLIDALHGYHRARFTADVTAGITVGVIALPLAIAFAIASGAKPEAGIFTAIIAGFSIYRDCVRHHCAIRLRQFADLHADGGRDAGGDGLGAARKFD
jgi:hypothetical protein